MKLESVMAKEWWHELAFYPLLMIARLFMVLQLSRAANINHLPELETSSEFTENLFTDLDIFHAWFMRPEALICAKIVENDEECVQ